MKKCKLNVKYLVRYNYMPIKMALVVIFLNQAIPFKRLKKTLPYYYKCKIV